MAGFDSSDIARLLPFGYRSAALGAGNVEYNGYVFPPALHSKVTIVPEYGENGITLKYLTIAINIEFIFTPPSNPVHEGELSQSNETSSSDPKNTDIRSLVKRLTQPGQALFFDAQGFGNFRVNAGTLQDVDYGPKPQVVEVQQLGGGNAVLIQWLCVTRVPHDLVYDNTKPFIQFSYDITWNWDPAGFMTRNIDGFFECPGYPNTSIAGDHPNTDIDLPDTQYKIVRDYVIKKFPLLERFRRTWSYRLRKDKRTFDFKIEDIEIRSGSQFPPGVSNIEVSQNVTSGLEGEGGFESWKLTFSGRIEAAHNRLGVSTSKKLAWFWLGTLVSEKRRKFEQLLQAQNIPGKIIRNIPGLNDTVKGGLKLTEEIAESVKEGHRRDYVIYPTHVSITDELYGNNITFTLSYIAIVTTSLLAKAVGLFERVELPTLTNETWIQYLLTADTYANSWGIGNELDGVEIKVDLCTPLVEQSTPPTAGVSEVSQNFSLGHISCSDNGKKVLDYSNSFTFLNDNHTIVANKLIEDAGTQDIVDTEKKEEYKLAKGNKLGEAEERIEPWPEKATIDPESEAQNTGSNNVFVVAASAGTKYVTMEGYAARYGKAINAPVLVSVGGAKAHRTGVFGPDQVKASTERTGLVDSDGNACDLYVTRWKKHYVLEGTPKSGRVKTTGIPERFN